MARGHLRIYLGAAPGVGKTFAMLNEGWRRRNRGADVVVGVVETHDRPNTAAQLRDLEVLPRRALEHRGAVLQEMDLDALLERHPQVALVDELAHTNVPGSRHTKRWEDVEELLDAGIDVISTVNIQHLESLNDVVQDITGVAQRETVPDAVVRAADQIELVDMSPESLRRRMAHGNVYRAEQVDAALANFFRVGNLSALRELALLWVADQVDEGLRDYRARHGISRPWETRERVVVALTGAPTGERAIRRGARIAARIHGELVGVHVRTTDGLASGGGGDLERHRELLAELGGRYSEVTGNDTATALVAFAAAENATQLVLGSSQRGRLTELVQGSVINDVIRRAGTLDVHVIGERADAAPAGAPTAAAGGRGRRRRRPLRRRLAALPPRRRAAGWVLGLLGVPGLALALAPARTALGPSGGLPELLIGVVVAAAVGGLWPGVTAAVLGFAVADWELIPPVHSLTIGRTGDAVALLSFLAVAVIVSTLIDTLARRTIREARAAAESEALARLAGGAVLSERRPLPWLLDELRRTFSLDAVAVLVPEGRGWRAEEASGAPVPRDPEGASWSAALAGDRVLAIVGDQLAAEDQRLLGAFVAQLRQVREQEELAELAASARSLAEANELRSALLAAVSHDLRTPIASIRAAAESLLSGDVRWSEAEVGAFAGTIEVEARRLQRLVDDLLDMSRVQAGALHPQARPIGVEEVVHAALASLSVDTSAVEVRVPETLPRVSVDAALLERAVANVVANAVVHSPPGTPIVVEAGAHPGGVDLRVVDRGPGIAPAERERAFAPFQRQGDGTSGGVGLGLAVSRGFVEAMGGTLVLDDTPGGGLTAVFSLPVAAPVLTA